MSLSPENKALVDETFGPMFVDPTLRRDGMVHISERGLNTLLDAARAEGRASNESHHAVAMAVEAAGGLVAVSPTIQQEFPELTLHRHDDRDGSIVLRTTRPTTRTPEELQDRMPR